MLFNLKKKLWGTWIGSEICLSCCISALVSQQWLATRSSVAVSFNRTGKAPTADFHTWFVAPFSWSGCFNCGFCSNRILLYFLVGFPNWHVSGCHFQEQVGWGTRLGFLHNLEVSPYRSNLRPLPKVWTFCLWVCKFSNASPDRQWYHYGGRGRIVRDRDQLYGR